MKVGFNAQADSKSAITYNQEKKRESNFVLVQEKAKNFICEL